MFLVCSGLLTGCAEVSLNLMAPGEAVDLLLRTGEVKDVDDTAVSEAAAEIAELCGNLPLYLSICGTCRGACHDRTYHHSLQHTLTVLL
jgi:hypothetical protein